ncbi:hypothetical protein RHS01_05540 [Rhizoctonia solani]|uniref:G domain-containing protein n=1 Tax=Rhizoctonia solani TaxID=456999 RepID=A0A8H7IB87_9AGAM|nr:hypothetical protein RHS01_05540 [Rhizoctonia solani]
MNDSAIFKKLIAYLARPREGRYGPKLSGILYLHSEEKAVGDERLKSTMEGLRHLVGDPWVPFITIGVIGKESNSNSTDMITQLQAPTSPSTLCTQVVPRSYHYLSNFLKSKSEAKLSFWPFTIGWSGPICRRINETQRDTYGHYKKSVHPRNKITYEESEASRHQLQFTLDETETELQSLRSQLEQTQLEYSSLRSELQLNDNTEQSKLVQSLSDLNRAVDDFGRSVAEHVVDNYKTDRFDEEDPTTLNALDFLGLQRQFGHQGGKSSLVASSKGEGLPIEDFIDLALRGFVCQKLCKNVFNPFHPTLTAGVEHDFMASLYEEVRRQASPIVASKWRANSFMALSKGNKLDQSMIESQVESLLAGDIQQLVNNLFGHSGVVTITDGQRSQLRNIVTSAWELNYVLKGEAVTLGDFQPLYVKSGTPFDSKAMVEFEADKKKKPGDVAIYTIRLGLTLSHSKGARQDAKPVVICPATVVTPRIFSYGNSNHEYEAPAFQTTVNIVITWDEPLYPPDLPPFTSIRATMTATNPEGQKNQKNTRGNSRASAKSGTPNNRPNASSKQTNGRTSGTVAAQDAAATPVNSVKFKDRIPHVPILILGVQGCGKSTFINAALAQPLREISNGLELATKEFHYDTLSSPKTNFILVDSPGFDNMSISDGEIMTKLIHFLCCGKAPAKMAGVIYLHTQESRLGSGVLRRNLSLIKALLGESFLERLTILIVPRPGEEVNEKEIIRPLLDTRSPFRNLCDLGAQVKVSSLKTEPIRNLLLPYAEKPPLLMSVQSELCGSGRIPNEGDINLYLVKCARAREGGPALTRSRVATQSISQIQNHVSSPARQGSEDVKKLELQLAESKKQMEDSHSQLQQHLSQYTALCSQLQIHENIEQSEIVQNLVDINRRIEDLALSLSQYLVNTYGGHDKVTTEYAAQLSKLKEMFEHDERKGSLVQSSKGVAHICPLPPSYPASDPKNHYTSKLYERIKEKETQATLGRWRTASFAAISGVIGEPELSRLKAQAGLDILNDNLMPMLGHLFGSGKSVKLSGAHKESLAELVTQAWDWCVMLKERIVLLGDYQPIAYRYGARFDTNIMTEFEPQPGSQHEQILSSIGLGLNVGLSQGTGEGPIRTNILKVSVVTEGWFRTFDLKKNIAAIMLDRTPSEEISTNNKHREDRSLSDSSGSSGSTPKPGATGIREVVTSREVLIGEQSKPRVPEVVRILIVGPSGSGKTSLIDTPGFDGVNMSDAEAFGEISDYLLNNEQARTGITGIIYVHRAGNAVHSRSLLRNFRVLKNIFLGNTGIARLTFLAIQTNGQDIGNGDFLVSPGSVFGTAFSDGAKFMQHPNQTGFVKLIRHYASQEPIILPIQLDKSYKVYNTFLNRVEKELGYYEYSSAQSLLDDQERQLREFYENQLSNQRESEIKLRQQLQQSQLEYSSLRSQLQLQENVEQSQVVQALKDINRMIDDFGRSVSAYLTDGYVQRIFGKDPAQVTSLRSRDMSTLRTLFPHREGRSSLIASSTKRGIQIEGFLDYSIRHFLCRFLCLRIFQPFHPEIDPSLSKLLLTSYDNIRKRESQAIAGKWRSETFKSLHQYDNHRTAEQLESHLVLLLDNRLRPLIEGVFGREISLRDEHIANLRSLIKEAWDWNAALKSGVIMLGDFVLTYFSRGRFDSK